MLMIVSDDKNMQYFYYIYKITFLCGKPFGRYYYGKRTYYGTAIENDKYTGSGIFCFAYFKKYGTEEGKTYIKEIIEINPDQEINKIREEYWIGDKYKTDPLCMNLVAGGAGCADHDTLCYVQDKYKKDISQYDLYGNFIRTWHGIREACRELQINRTGVTACLSGKKPSAFGYQWRYSNGTEEPIEPFYRIIKIVQYTRDGNIVAEYDSPIDAEKSIGIDSGSIKSTCQGKRPSAGGFIWRFKGDSFDKYRTRLMTPSETRVYEKKIRPILQFTKGGQFIKEYENVSAALIAVGKTGSRKETSIIYEVANGNPRRKTAYGYKWKFKDQLNENEYELCLN